MAYEGYRELFVALDPPPAPSDAALAMIGGIIYIRAIGLATSSDGLAWTKSGTAPVLLGGASGNWDDGGVGTPFLLPGASADRMWYTGWGSGPTAIGLATFDGASMTWENSASPVLSPGVAPAWDSAGIASPSVVFDGTQYRMWYAAGGDLQGGPGIGMATSPDGVTWTKSASNPVLLPGAPGDSDQDGVGSACVIQDGLSYRMWYAGWKMGHVALCSASSSDGLSWTKDSGNPVLAGGPPGSWNSQGVFTPSVLLENGTFRMWMAGRNDFLEPQIGYATNP
jgi:hypothetical protein